jgi:hypothetical protein
MITTPPIIHVGGELPLVRFDDPEQFRALDARRWRSGERNTCRRRSPVQGYGSFATRLIRLGEPVFVRQPRSGNFPVNHSDRPNTARAANRCGLFALRDIAPGEEVTEDYRYLPYFEQAIPALPQRLIQATPEDYRRLLAKARLEVLGGPDPAEPEPKGMCAKFCGKRGG